MKNQTIAQVLGLVVGLLDVLAMRVIKGFIASSAALLLADERAAVDAEMSLGCCRQDFTAKLIWDHSSMVASGNIKKLSLALCCMCE